MTLMITVLIENDPKTFIEYSQYMGIFTIILMIIIQIVKGQF